MPLQKERFFMANNVSTRSEEGLAAKSKDGYHFKAVTTGILINDMRFNKGTPAAGSTHS